MNDSTPIDTKSAEAIGVTLQAFKTSIIDAKKASSDARAEATAMRTAIDEKLAGIAAEVKTFGTGHADSKAVLSEMSVKMASLINTIGEHEKAATKADGQINEFKEVVERLASEVKRRGGTDENEKTRQEEVKSARFLLEVKAAHEGKAVDPRKPIEVTSEQVQTYSELKSAFNDMLRMPTSIKQGMEFQSQTAQQQKAVSTFTHGNQFWLPSEISEMIIACYKHDTDLTGMVGQMMISRGSIVMMVDNYVSNQAYFKCEIDNSSGMKSDVTLPGTIELTAHEQFADQTVTHTMIEDAAIDIQSFIAMRAGQQFVRGLNDKILNGTGVGMPDGILRKSNHLTMQSGAAGTASGGFGWQDLQNMTVKLEPRFQRNSIWWMSTNALASTTTMTDGFGRPIFSAAVLNSEGLPMLMGHPLVQVVQMPDSLQAVGGTGPFVPGTTPIMLGDWMQNYTLVIRRGFTAIRNPFIDSKNGVRWEFSQRVGGGVLCRSAALGLEIV